MSVNGMSVGKDYSFGFYDQNTGEMIDLGDVQSIRISPRKHDLKNQPYNDVPKFGYIPDGYAISGTAVRTGPNLEDFQLTMNQNFNAGQNIQAGYLNETIYESDGSVSRYQYTGVVIWIGDIGDVSREQAIKMQFEAMASNKKKLSA